MCRFAGTTTRDGQIEVRAETTRSGGLTTVDVSVTFAISAFMSDVRYYGQEISTWRGRELQQVAVNQRTLIDGSVKRQQWDLFERIGARLEAYRVQAKRLADFRERHPGFVQHWALASFGQPWLADYRHAQPERRPDLDLLADGAARSPLAFAFYWSRFLPPDGGAAPVVLPGFKRDKQAILAFGPAVQGEGWRRWSSPLRHPGLATAPASLAAVWVSPQAYLLQIGFEVHNSLASGQALIRAEGCRGVQIRPD